MTFIVKIISENQLEDWDKYIFAHPEATFCHRAGWYRVIKKAFGHQPFYLAAFDKKGQVTGVMPLFENKSLLFGHALISQPFCVYGGILSDSAEIREKLESSAVSLARQLNVDYLELRTILNRENADRVESVSHNWRIKSIHSTFIRELASNEKDNLALVKYKQRAVVRKCLKNDLQEEFPYTIDEFFYAYSTSVRNLGTPVFSRAYFQALKDEFADDCKLVSVKHKGVLHCALMSFYFRDTVLPYYGGGLPFSRDSKAMDFMYFRQMCRAGEKGFKKYDFGRSKNGTGSYNYKRHWGFEATPLHYQYLLVKGTELPDLNPLNPKYQLMIKTWKRLPLWLSQLMGPMVSKYLG